MKTLLTNHTAACAAVLSLCTAGLTACSSDADAPKVNTPISINVDVPRTGTRAYWEYSDTYTAGAQLAFSWNDDDNSIAVIQGGNVIKGDLDTKENKVKFDGNVDETAYLVFPYSENPLTMTLPTSYTQSGESTGHLSQYMYMYATVNPSDFTGESTVELSHAPAILRFLVSSQRETSNPTITVNGALSLSASLVDGNLRVAEAVTQKIEVACPDYTLNAGETVALYALCFPTVTTGDYTFTIQVADNKYQSNVISGSKIGQFKSGYYYTFNMKLDDKLTVELQNVSSFQNWGNANDEIDL